MKALKYYKIYKKKFLITLNYIALNNCIILYFDIFYYIFC